MTGAGARAACYAAATEADLQVLRRQLGRAPRGVVGIAARCAGGHPAVVVTAPRLPDGSPFPTTFYLTCPRAVRGCSVLEAGHEMDRFAELVRSDAQVARAYAAAHRDYLRRRELLGHVPQIAGVSAGGMPTRVKCLHAVVAHALAAGPGVNPIGDRALDMLRARGLYDPATCR